jgi:hypothetical protein
MEDYNLDKLCVTQAPTFARLLAIPTCSAPTREEAMLSPEVLTVKPTVLAKIASLPQPAELLMEESHLDNLLAMPLLVFALILSLATPTPIATKPAT